MLRHSVKENIRENEVQQRVHHSSALALQPASGAGKGDKHVRLKLLCYLEVTAASKFVVSHPDDGIESLLVIADRVMM